MQFTRAVRMKEYIKTNFIEYFHRISIYHVVEYRIHDYIWIYYKPSQFLECVQNLLYLLISFSRSVLSCSTATESRLLFHNPVRLFSNSPIQKTIAMKSALMPRRTRVNTATMISFSWKLFGGSVFWLADPVCPCVDETPGGVEEMPLGEFEVDSDITIVKFITKKMIKILIVLN